MNIAGVVILYHPNLDLLSANIQTYVSGLKQLYVYDNSETKTPGIEEALLKIQPSIQYHYFNSNEGIAKRLNQAMDQAALSQYDYLLTMDQDSSFKAGDFEKYKNMIQSSDFDHVAQFGVNCQPDFTQPKEQPEEALTLITSGTILNLTLTKHIGPFNEDLFIDFALGTLVEGRGLGNFKKSMRIIHAPIRVFYIVRNGLYLFFKSKGLTSVMKKDVIRCIKIIKNDLIYNPQLFSVYKNVFAGIYAFMTNRMGKK